MNGSHPRSIGGSRLSLRGTAVAVAATCAVVLALAAGLALVLTARDAATTRSSAGPGTVVAAQDGRDGQVLRAGNVILVAGRERVQEAGALARELAGGEATGALRASGQAVIVRRGPGGRGIVALAWRHQQRVERADEPALAAFVEHWLGRGA